MGSRIQRPGKKNVSNWPDPIYTKKSSESKKYEGWTKEGIARFHQLQTDYVPKTRKSSEEVEKQLLKKYSSSGRVFEGIRREYQFFTLLESEDEEENMREMVEL